MSFRNAICLWSSESRTKQIERNSGHNVSPNFKKPGQRDSILGDVVTLVFELFGLGGLNLPAILPTP